MKKKTITILISITTILFMSLSISYANASLVSAGSSSDLDRYRAPYTYSSPSNKTIVGMGISSSNRSYVWYSDGTVSAGSTSDLDSYRALYRYSVAPGKTPYDIVGMGISTSDRVYVWYSDGTVSAGSSSDLDRYRAPYRYSLAPGKTPRDIVGMGISSSNRSYVWYSDGTVSAGSTSDLDSYRALYRYSAAAGKAPGDIAGMAISTSDRVYAWYRGSSMTMVMGTSTADISELEFDNSYVLSSTNPVEPSEASVSVATEAGTADYQTTSESNIQVTQAGISSDYDITVQPGDTGHYENQQVREVKIHIINICDSDGGNCGNATRDFVQEMIDNSNALHYRSNSQVRFVIDESSDFNTTLNDDDLNNDCILRNDLKVSNVDVDGDGDEEAVLAYAWGYELYQGDINNDGEIDDADADSLCIPVNQAVKDQKENLILQNIHTGAVPVLFRNGQGRPEFNEDLSRWFYMSGGTYSGCKSPNITLTNYDSSTLDDMEHMVFSHESGHYFCLPHTARTNLYIKDAVSMIKNYLDPSTQTQLPDPSLIDLEDPLVKEEILANVFDWDFIEVDYGSTSYINNYVIDDTPADPGRLILREIYGDRGECGLNNNTVDIDVDYGDQGILHYGTDTFTFSLTPDRRNIEHDGCFPGYMHMSPDQVNRIHGVTDNHRSSSVTPKTIATWRNSNPKPIPINRVGEPIKYGRSYIEVSNANKGTDKITVGVDISHPRGGLHIQLISPSGDTIDLHEPETETGKINGFLLSEGIKTLFFVKDGVWLKNGIWELRVWEDAHAEDLAGYINDWQIQFEDCVNCCSNANLVPDEFEVNDSKSMSSYLKEFYVYGDLNLHNANDVDYYYFDVNVPPLKGSTFDFTLNSEKPVTVQLLSIADGDILTSDIFMVKESVYGTNINFSFSSALENGKRYVAKVSGEQTCYRLSVESYDGDDWELQAVENDYLNPSGPIEMGVYEAQTSSTTNITTQTTNSLVPKASTGMILK